jgi:hypothetical protein
MSQFKTSIGFPVLRQKTLGAFEFGQAVAKIFYWIVLFWLGLQSATTPRSNCAKWFKPWRTRSKAALAIAISGSAQRPFAPVSWVNFPFVQSVALRKTE